MIHVSGNTPNAHVLLILNLIHMSANIPNAHVGAPTSYALSGTAVP